MQCGLRNEELLSQKVGLIYDSAHLHKAPVVEYLKKDKEPLWKI